MKRVGVELINRALRGRVSRKTCPAAGQTGRARLRSSVF